MNEDKNIVLIGMPGSGKTTLGKQLASRLGRTFVDADDFVVQLEGKTIADMFAVSEEYFRDAETRAAQELAKRRGLVVACGGGVIKRDVNIKILKRTGVVIFLDRSPDDIVTDVDVASRPLLKDGKQKVYDLYNERIALYWAAADYTIVNDKKAEEILDELVRLSESI
ncbi:shikimate kinase [Megasphaera sp. SW808]|uniref:shikimate kinase n=1 Tax=Megasphaera sp. SW808 TaxID=2530045 RepID=UPI00143CA9CF|nr:shikimate kinase [Megasphaera sp. SW808]NJE33861.1 shikimate kinase [Megasphaera sp. SW808]